MAVASTERTPRPRIAARRAHGRHRALLWLVGLAVVYRALSYAAIGPLVVPSDDSLRYAQSALAPGRMFTDPFAPSGYPLFLAGLHAVWGAAGAVTLLQHLLGIGGGLAMLALGLETRRRTGLPRWAAFLPGALVLLGGDVLFFEQSLMTEALFIALVIAGVLLAARSERDEGAARAWTWLLAAGACLGAAAAVRTVGIPVALAVAAWALARPDESWWRRILGGVAAGAGAGFVVGAYLLAATAGTYSGYGTFDGWNLYGRVAPFADCTKFTPPAATRRMCEHRPPNRRPGIYFYHFAATPGPYGTSPALRAFAPQPRGDDELRAFAIRAIEGQPFAYARTVVHDALRYVDPTFGRQRPLQGAGPEFMTYRTRVDDYPPRDEVEALYGYTPSQGPLFTPYESWLQVSRVPGLAWALCLVACAAGLLAGRGPGRRLLTLLVLVTAAIGATPLLTVTYEYRFGVPAQPFLLLAGLLGVWLVMTRRRTARGGTSAALADSPAAS